MRQLLSALTGSPVWPDAEVLGPVPVGDAERAILRVAPERGLALADALHAGQGQRAARKDRDPVKVQVDPLDLV